MKIIHSYSTKKKNIQLEWGKDIVRLETSLAIFFLLIAFPAIFSAQKTLSRRWSLEEVPMSERSWASPAALLQPGHPLTCPQPDRTQQLFLSPVQILGKATGKQCIGPGTLGSGSKPLR